MAHTIINISRVWLKFPAHFNFVMKYIIAGAVKYLASVYTQLFLNHLNWF